MAKAKLYAVDGNAKSDVELSEKYFESEVSKGCLYLTVKAYLANQRQGTHKTKTKTEVSGTGSKPWKQKGTGNARAGDNRSSIWVRGAKAHGPKPRDYRQKVNKKVKFKALLSALSLKATSENVFVFENLSYKAPKTSEFAAIMANVGVSGKKTLFLAAESDVNLLKSAGNLTWARVIRVQDVNTYQVMWAENLVLSQDALDQLTSEAK